MSTKSKPLLTVLGGISAEHFLSEFWQKKPLIIRQAFPGYTCPVTSDELAGLAMEDEVESRLILEKDGSAPWELRTGPFDEQTFSTLPKSHWTLLIQQLDAWAPEINQLKSAFDFIPNWRIDDIMASYAPIGGSVGPHFDQYDVFLLQAGGHRSWKTGQRCDDQSPCLAETDLSILENFETEQEWLLAPGDMLYLPPGLAHYGVATDDCITLSIGFRAPSHQQLLSDFTDHLLESISSNTLYQDPNLATQAHAGEITSQSIHQVSSIIEAYLNNKTQFNEWFGRFITEPKNTLSLGEDAPDFTAEELHELVSQQATLYRNEGARFAYIENPDHIALFVDGHDFQLIPNHLSEIQLLCGHTTLIASELLKKPIDKPLFKVIHELIQQGSLYF